MSTVSEYLWHCFCDGCCVGFSKIWAKLLKILDMLFPITYQSSQQPQINGSTVYERCFLKSYQDCLWLITFLANIYLQCVECACVWWFRVCFSESIITDCSQNFISSMHYFCVVNIISRKSWLMIDHVKLKLKFLTNWLTDSDCESCVKLIQ